MPTDFLSAEQARAYGRFGGEPTPAQLARFFHLDDADRAFVGARRGEHMRLGCALQLATVRFLGTFLEDPAAVPAGAAAFLARQLGVRSSVEAVLADYQASPWRWRHPPDIRRRYGYCEFGDGPARFRLHRWLYALFWTGTERPGVLFDRATAWLLAHKVLLPGATTLERAVARVRTRASERLWGLLADRLTPAQRGQLEGLPAVGGGGEEGGPRRQSALDRLRDGPVRQTPAELARAVERLTEVQTLVRGLPSVERLPRSRLLSLACFAGAAKAQAVARMPERRRLATLLAFARTLEATAQDDVLDLFDLVVGRLFADAARVGQQARLRSLRDLDAAALTLREACVALLGEGEDGKTDHEHTPAAAGHDVRAAVFAAVSRERIAAAVVQVEALARPAGDPYFEELLLQHRRLRRFLPALVRAVGFGANPAGAPVLAAIHHLREVGDHGARGQLWPLEFVPRSWRGQVVGTDGGVDARAWTLCLAERMRAALRRRDLFAAPSVRYADPRLGLLDGAAWEASRPTVCRTLGLSGDADAEVARLGERLDAAYRLTLERLPANPGVRLTPARGGGEKETNGVELVLSALDEVPEPPGLVALRVAVAARLPRVDLPELLLEVAARTGFAAGFTHASEARARAGELATSLCAVLLAEACNTGLEPLARPDAPALTRARLSWVKQNYLRAETLAAANAALVAAQAGIPLARAWGGGEVASADGLRFVVPVRTVHAGPNPLYFGTERGVTYYNLVSERFTGLGGIVVPGTLRDSLTLLSVVLEQPPSGFEPAEIMTDTGAYTDVMFGVFWLLGFQFSPRLAHAGAARLWRLDKQADYGAFNGLTQNRINAKLIIAHWDDLLRLAGSLKLGLAPAAGLIRTLQTHERPTPLARALAELGRVIKSLYLLAYLDDETLRRRILGQLNRHEGRHALARTVFHGQRGELRQRYRQGQEDQLGALGLVVNAIVLWNTIYLDATLARLRAEGHPVAEEDAARLSPLGCEHINVLGRYAFTLPEPVARGELRPLRDPASAQGEDAA